MLNEANEVVEGASFEGRLIRPGDADYDNARKIYNGMFDRRPSIIARCASTAGVVSIAN